jgi:hypothetical protein
MPQDRAQFRAGEIQQLRPRSAARQQGEQRGEGKACHSMRTLCVSRSPPRSGSA